MSKYLITWEADESIWPTDPKEQGALGIKLAETRDTQWMKEMRSTYTGICNGITHI